MSSHQSRRARRPLQYLLASATALLTALTLLVGSFNAFPALAAPLSGAEDWPAYRHDNQGTGVSGETALSTANASQLARLWSYQTGGVIAASPTVVGGTAYVGSWDGYEYAFDTATGAVKWKTFLGTTTAPICSPPSAGITSSASVVGGVVYVGGGDAYSYALDATTGAVLWKIFTGDNSATGGHYNWSSPLIYGGYEYIGVASLGDCPLVQGLLMQVDLTTHTVTNTLKLVPDGQVGAGIWTTPVIDPTLNTIYFTTGTRSQPGQPLAQAMVAVDATTLAIKGSWTVPSQELVPDADWGNSPTLTTDANNRQLVVATSKNGFVYAFDRTNVSVGPVWQRLIAWGGDCPTCGDGSVSSGVAAGGKVFEAGGNTAINGTAFAGSVRALDSTTGAILWERGEPGIVLPALAYTNGLLIVGAGSVLQVLDAATGVILYSYDTGALLYGPPSVSNGTIFIGTTYGKMLAFALAAPTPPPAPDSACPTGWTCQDVGAPTSAGAETVASGVWSVTAAGTGATGAADQLRLMTTTQSGDLQITGQVTGLPDAIGLARVGLVVRQNASPGAPNYTVLLRANGAVQVQYRKAQDGTTNVVNTVAPGPLPRYLAIQRINDLFQAAISSDGATYTLVPGTSAQVVMPTSVLVGLMASSGASATTVMATVATVAIGAPTTSFQPAPSPSACPAGWTCADVGNPNPVGDQTLNAGAWTVQGSGADLGALTDQFHFVWQTAAADATVSANITTQATTNAAAKAGVMLRAGAKGDSGFYGAFVTPGNGILALYRGANGAASLMLTNPAGTAPTWLRVTRSGATFTTYTSTDGVAWTPLTGSSIALPALAGPLLAGLAITSHAPGTLGAATMSAVTVSNSAPPPPPPCPAPWTCADIGPVINGKAGSQSLANGVWNILGAGVDIWSASDTFHYVWQSLAADGSINAHVTAQSNTNPWAKAGVMLRASNDPASAYYALLVTPTNGLVVQARAATGAQAFDQTALPGNVPTYLRVGRVGNTLSAYTSTDGVTWTLVAGSSATLAGMSGPLLAGLAVSSHDIGTLSAVTLDSVALNTSVPPPACPANWTCADLGAPQLAGTQSLANGVWSIQGAGNDIWGTSDQFHYVWQSLTADGILSAHITAQSNTSPWAKAGVMLRASNDPTSAFYGAFVTPGNGVVVQYRATTGAQAAMSAQLAGTVPAYLRVSRVGTTFSAYTSTDGATWTLIPGATLTLAAMNGSLLAGLAVTSHNGGALSAVAIDTVTLTIPAPGCPSGWTCADLGAPQLAGTQALANGVWTMQGAGNDIWGTNDQFHYVWQSLAADGSISAHVTAQSNTNPWAKAGVMLRASNDPASAFYGLFVTPGNGVVIQYRATTGAQAAMSVQFAGAIPAYVRVGRVGNTLSAYTSTDGATWTLVAGSGATLAGMTGSLLAGLAVTSHNGGALSAVTMDSVAISTTAPPPTCPSGWTCADLGTPQLSGAQTLANGVWSIQGAGNDIWGASDQFHYIWQALASDGTLSAHVTAQGNTSAWAKAGVMLRASNDPASAFYGVFVTPGNGVVVQYRATTGAQAAMSAQLAGTTPAYLRVGRVGNTLSAYTSTDGATWTLVAGSSATLAGMSGALLRGLAVTSHNGGQVCNVAFDGVALG